MDLILEKLQRQDERLKNIENLLSQTKEVLSIDEVSQYTGLSKSTIYKLTCYKLIPHYKQAKHLFFSRPEIDLFLKSNKINTQTEIKEDAISSVVFKEKGGSR